MGAKNISRKNSGLKLETLSIWASMKTLQGSSGSKAKKISILQDWAWLAELDRLWKTQPLCTHSEKCQLNFAIFECRERRLPWAEPVRLIIFSASHKTFQQKIQIFIWIFFKGSWLLKLPIWPLIPNQSQKPISTQCSFGLESHNPAFFLDLNSCSLGISWTTWEIYRWQTRDTCKLRNPIQAGGTTWKMLPVGKAPTPLFNTVLVSDITKQPRI